MAPAFFDTNVVLYLVGSDSAKAARSEALLAAGGVVSVQVLNEFASVASRKQRLSSAEIIDVLSVVRSLCRVEPLLPETHDKAVRLASDHSFSFYDALIVAAAATAGCDTLYSEHLQHGRRLGGRLTIRNPFRP
jgi:predicted nucleic acid-binding protein